MDSAKKVQLEDECGPGMYVCTSAFPREKSPPLLYTGEKKELLRYRVDKAMKTNRPIEFREIQSTTWNGLQGFATRMLLREVE